jgi:hypothetical protein
LRMAKAGALVRIEALRLAPRPHKGSSAFLPQDPRSTWLKKALSS